MRSALRNIVTIGVVLACGSLVACEALIGDEERPLRESQSDAASDDVTVANIVDGATTDAPVVPTGCEGSPRTRPEVLDERCGVFVAPNGLDFNPGTRAQPAQTLAAAVRAALNAHVPFVFVCSGVYAETLDLGATGVSFSGGFGCDGGVWTIGAQPSIVRPADGVALRVKGTTNPIVFEGMRFEAVSASQPGASSVVAQLTSAANVTFAASELVAGAGAKGANGDPGVVAAGGGEAGNVANAGANGAEKVCSCKSGSTDFGTTSGGAGGVGTTAPTAGTPALGAGGAGSNGAPCTPGSVGASGASGNAAAVPTMAGALVADAWTPTRGADGTPGSIAQGGGGGGAYGDGYAGGGGGCGGCPSTGGSGGQGGGGSIGIVALDTTISLVDTRVQTAQAGAGGNGGDAPSGQVGGAGQGNLAGMGCAGGQGGTGGSGGPGGGGAGGSSIGIAFHGPAPTIDAASDAKFAVGSAGAPGTGRIPGPTHVAPGPAGISAKTWSVP